MYNVKVTGQRISEVGVISVLAYGVNTYLLKNSGYFSTTYYMGNAKTVGVIILSDIVGEYVNDMISNQSIGYF